MATVHLPPDFKEFLQLLSAEKVKYLLVGGYAVGYYGYPRATADMDIWIATDKDNASKIESVIRAFGFRNNRLNASLFQNPNQIIRMGKPPLRIEVITSASGIKFNSCFKLRKTVQVDGIMVNLISLQCLKKNKKAAGRYKDLDDLEHLI